MKTTKSEAGFAHLVIIVLVLALVVGAGYYVLSKQKSANSTSTAATSAKTLSHPGIVQSELFASSVDTSGAPVKPTKTFSVTEPKIFVVVGLNNAKTTQRIEYTRYLNGKFVDNGSISVSKDGAKYASFSFVVNPGKTHPKGTYLVKTYTNGVFEKSASYKVE